MTTSTRLAATAALAITLALPAPSRADIFSPGELCRPHASLEGLKNCTKCHEAGEQLKPEHCLECHKELQARVLQRRGYHGRLGPNDRNCQTCHHEHQGRDFKIVDWGQAGKKGFDHAKTGWLLENKHAKVECAKCHDPRRITDVEVRKVLEKGRESWLGQPTACAACHFDEHRAQLGTECQGCHDTKGWKPARFDHAKAAYKLEGKHAKVQCVKCHADQPAPPPGEQGAKSAPVRPALVARYKPVPFQACIDCHKKDPHQGRFGEACQNCHVPNDWKEVKGIAKEKAFHEKTRYPLRGGHLRASCEACHGAGPGQKAVYRGLAFEKCTDCHFDAHLGQLEPAKGAPAAPGTKTCDRCHVVDGFTPVRFELEDHQKVAYRLEGAHRTVACAACHPKDARLEGKVPAAVRQKLEQRKRPVKPSLALFSIPRAAKDCRACHKDPHGGQFQARLDKDGCAGCHGLEAFRPAKFDHQRDSRFKLEGKHEKAACASCHRPGDAGVVRYKPLPLTCAGCHPDQHAGQLAVKGKGTDCARCHEAGGWKAPLVRFVHDKDSRYKLEGKHAKVECAKCHPMATLPKVGETRRYKPLPTDCQGCHSDFHKSAFRGFKP